MSERNNQAQILIRHPKGLGEILKNHLLLGVADFEAEDFLVITVDRNRVPYLLSEPMAEELYELLYFWQGDVELKSLFEWCERNIGKISLGMKVIGDGKPATIRVTESMPNYREKVYAEDARRIVSKLYDSLLIPVKTGAPDIELRIVKRSGYGYVGIKLGGSRESSDQFQQGSIRKEIAAAMIYLSEPRSDDLFIDPMCGSGMIPLLRAQLSPYRMIWATDKDISKIKKKLSSLGWPRKFKCIEGEIATLKDRLSGQVTKIVVDPPWGLMRSESSLTEVYRHLLDFYLDQAEDSRVMVVVVKDAPTFIKLLEERGITQYKLYQTETSGMPSHLIKV